MLSARYDAANFGSALAFAAHLDMSEVALPSAGKGEFPRLQDSLVEVERLLDVTSADFNADASIDSYATATALLAEMKPRAEVFERRAKETDVDRKVYGPKMVQRVLEFCAALQAADERALEMDDQLIPARSRREAAAQAAVAEEAAAAAAVAEAARLAELEREAAAAAAEEAARIAAEEEAQRHAAAIAAPLAGAPAGSSMDTDDPNPMIDDYGRRAIVSGLDLQASLELLLQSTSALVNEPNAFGEALQGVHSLCANVVAHPEESSFRSIRLLNGHFQQSVARHSGGVEVLMAIGFVEKDGVDEEGDLFYVLEEPNLEDDYERWADWYEGIKRDRDVIGEVMQAKGVRQLPAVTKGTGWSEMTEPRRPAQPDVMTLHGQKGGGL